MSSSFALVSVRDASAFATGELLPGAFLFPLFFGHDAAKSEMFASGADFAFSPCADHVASAVLLGAEKGAAPMNARLLVRLSRVK